MKKLLHLIVACVASLTSIAQTTVVIQPHFTNGKENNLTTIDTTSPSCLGSALWHYADSNEYVIKEFDAIAWTASGCPDFVRHILRFDALKDPMVIPYGAVISSARLILYGMPSSPLGNYGNSYYPGSSYPNPNATWLYELADTFNTYTLTWNNQPSVLHVDSVSIPESNSRWNENDTMDVTALVADMVANANTGFLFRLQDETYYQARMYAACYHPDSTLHPALIVTYVCVPSITGEPISDTVLAGDTAVFSVTTIASSPSYQWQEDPGTGFVDLANVWPYSGVNTNMLTIQDASMYLNLTHYRCLIGSAPACADTSSAATLVIRGGLGVKTVDASSVHIFPNPAHDELTVQLPAQFNKGSICLTDELGQVIFSKKITGTTESFDLSKLSPGLYFLKIYSGSDVVYKKVIRE